MTLTAEVDALGGGAPTGFMRFWQDDVLVGSRSLTAIGGGQATLSGGGFHACALSNAGGVRCWGDNVYGQIGDGTTINRSTPMDVVGLTQDVIAIAAGYRHTCALTRVGGVKCWGSNEYGQLGDGTRTTRHTPVSVSGLSSGAVAVGLGTNHSCALMRTGGVKCWGGNDYGMIGDGTHTGRLKPTNVFGLTVGAVGLAVGGVHSCAVTGAGALKCWGGNGFGQVGAGPVDESLIPVTVLASGVVAAMGGGSHSCAIMRSGGLKCWGNNYTGQTGTGGDFIRRRPADVVGLSSGVAAVSGGWRHTCAVLVSGGVKCWGINDKGQIGDGMIGGQKNTPVDVQGLPSGVVAVEAGLEFSCVLGAAGSVKCWGDNSSGQIGDGTTVMRPTPTATQNFLGLVRARATFVTAPLTSGVDYRIKATFPGDATHTSSGAALIQKVQ